jgi:arabinogalactan oligomer/maltooligosaccharide transport system permease protein
VKLGLAAIAAAVACGVAPPAHAQDLVFWHHYGDRETAALRAVAREFEEAHPGVRVRFVHTPFGAYAAKLESAIPTGHGPDVFIDAHERLFTYARAGLVEPIGPLGLEERLEFEPLHLESLAVDGVQHGLPVALKTAALYVNTRHVPTPPETLEDIATLPLPEGVWPLVFEAESSYYNGAILHAFGGRLIDDEGRWAFEGDAAESALRLVADMTERGIVPEEPSGDLVTQLFGSGRAATAISGPWIAGDLPDDLEYSVVPLPPIEAAGMAPMRPYVTIEGVFVAAHARSPELARELARFVAGRQGALIRAKVGGQIVAARSPWEDPELATNQFLRTFREASLRGIPMSTHPNMRMAFEPAMRAIRKTLRGDVPPDEALAEARHRFDDVTRPLPPERSPTMLFVVLGLILFLVAAQAVRNARDPGKRERFLESLPAYRYVAHAAIAVGLLVIGPLVVGAATSLFAGYGTDMHYVGLANYVDILTARGGELLGHGSFYLVLAVTVLWTLLNVLFHVTIGVALALLLNRPGLRLKGTYRVLLILPWAVPSYVTALSWKGMFHRQFGAINAILDAVGVEPVSWFAQWSTAFTANVATNVWLGFPFMMVVTLGALAAIPKDLYEAAAVDGASAWQRFRLITVPNLKPMIAPAVVMGSVWTFNMFNVIYLVSGGEPDGSTEILVSEAYRWAFTRSAQYGYAAAYAVLIFGILLFGTRTLGRRVEGMGATT